MPATVKTEYESDLFTTPAPKAASMLGYLCLILDLTL